MKRFINNYLWLAPVLLCTAVAQSAPQAEPPVQKDYAACFAAWDKNMHTLSTDFEQTTEYDGMLISSSQGRIRYAQNGPKLRLDNLENGVVSQSALTDKKTILLLDEKGKKITEANWADWLTGQPNQALFDFGNYTALIARHNVSVQQRKDGQAVLLLTPKNKKEDYKLRVTIAESDCFPVHISVQSDLMTTSAKLTDIRLNAELQKDVFKGITK